MTNCWWVWGVRGPINISPELWSNSVKSASAGDIQQVCDRNLSVYGGFKTWPVGELGNESNEPPCNSPDSRQECSEANRKVSIDKYMTSSVMVFGAKEV